MNNKHTPQEPQPAMGTADAVSGPKVENGAHTKHKRFTQLEREEKIKEIELRSGGGATTLKDAIKRAGISEQTYYLWKRAARTRTAGETKENFNSVDDEYESLLQLENRLEKENQELRKALLEKLKYENSRLKRKLGMFD
ncbi:transcriptional regulator [Rhizobium leguminosarum]|uniref:transposase n=1 Tax=Rhizobium leguminosarum TaxID=384 RepID=UPI003ED02D6A